MIHITLITKCYVFIDKDGRGLWTVFGKKVPAFCNVGVRLHGMHGIASSYLFHYTKSLHYATFTNANFTKTRFHRMSFLSKSEQNANLVNRPYLVNMLDKNVIT